MKQVDKLNNYESKVICPKFEQTFTILGKKWTGLIIEVLLEGPCRFKDISNSIDGVSDRVLVERIKELEAKNIVTREMNEDCNIRFGYRLTEKGEALREVMEEIQDWADEWICNEDLQKK